MKLSQSDYEPIIHAALDNGKTRMILTFCERWHIYETSLQWQGKREEITCPACIAELERQDKLGNEIIDKMKREGKL